MKKKELLRDDFLTDLMNNTSLESPSDDFAGNIMNRIESMPAYQPHKKNFFLIFRKVFPWILLVAGCVIFYIFWDLPFGKYIPGGESIQTVLLPTINTFFSSFKEGVSNKFYSIALVIFVCSAGLFVIERLISHRVSANRHYLI